METRPALAENDSEHGTPVNGFRAHGYCILRELLDPTSLFQHMQSLLQQGRGSPDALVRGSLNFYREERFERVLEELVPVVETHAGCKVFKTYSFARQYGDGQRLKAHRDRPSCEISISLCLGNQGRPWPLWILDRAGIPRAVELDPGDALLYSGMQVTHWRQTNTFGTSSHLFLHYVDRNGPFAIHRDDAYRPRSLSLPFFSRVLSFEIRPAYRARRSDQA